MAYNGTNPVSVGNETLKSHYDRVFDNTVANNARLDAMDLTAQRLWSYSASSRLSPNDPISSTTSAPLCITSFGEYVVIGTNAGAGTDVIWRSSNGGENFTKDSSLDSIMNQCYGLAFGSSASMLVAVGGSSAVTHEIAYSTDYGDTWTGAQVTGATMYAVCWSGSLFVAVGASGKIYTSSNGTSWTARTAAGTPANITLTGVCWSASLSLFIAVGTDSTAGAHIEIQTSPDGITWTARTAAAGTATNMRDVREIDLGSNTYIFMIGDSGEIQYSSNGTSWTLHPHSSASSISTLHGIIQIPCAAFITNADNKMGLITSLSNVMSYRFFDDNIAPASGGVVSYPTYNSSIGIVVAGAAGQIWRSCPPEFTSL